GQTPAWGNLSIFNLTATSVCAGLAHTCAVVSSADVNPTINVYCWGDGNKGQLGVAGSSTSPVSVPISTATDVPKQVACGTLHTCALMTNHKIKCWGANDNNERGDGTDDPSGPTPRD